MNRCHTCSAEIPPGHRFCGRCGAPAGVDSQSPTRMDTTPRGAKAASGTISSSETSGGRFLPGTVLAGRYRVVGLLGRGGMGEVYRADDLKLGQAVALKFLPAALERDAGRLQRFLNEVRTSRQVSHANVGRVYDVGEAEGQHFLSMEYVDGEDLASLLRRIGRLPQDKGIQIARQLAAGLAAAHEAGVLHRDLKPSNVMIDGRGRARITDFGLAALAGEVEGAEVRSGTPAYMAPEQLAGREVTARSDIYSLGLVLYELFTGRTPFAAGSAADRLRQQAEGTPAPPSSVLEGIDPAVERIVLRCLERDPARRPGSALAIAAALPGGDPLAAALAAGETPSPELLAEAGDAGGLRPAAAATMVAAVAAGVVLLIFLSGRVHLLRQVPLEVPPAALVEKARDLVRAIGYVDPPVDSTYDFAADWDYLRHLEQDGWTAEERQALRTVPPAAVCFRYRQSPRLLMRVSAGSIGDWMEDPAPRAPGELRVDLDTRGRLLELVAIPPERPEASGVAGEPDDWSPLLVAAGFQPDALSTVPPAWTPPVYGDRRAAWEGAYAGARGVPVRVEAAAFAGRPVSFRVVEPWTRPAEAGPPRGDLWSRLSRLVTTVWFLVVLVGASVLAVRNVRLGRGDRRTALRFAIYLGGARLVWLIGAHHVPDQEELDVFTGHLAWSCYRVALVALFYLALEPYARRFWPRMLVSWVRLFDGRYRDPLVGRDLLTAGVFGVAFASVIRLSEWIGGAGPTVSNWSWESLRGIRGALTSVVGSHTESVLFIMVGVMLLPVLRLILRRTWIAVAVLSVLILAMVYSGGASPVVTLASIAVNITLFWIVLLRVGLLSLVVGMSIVDLFTDLPLTFDLGAWHAPPTVILLIAVGALTIHAFRASVAGRPIFRDEVVEATARAVQ